MLRYLRSSISFTASSLKKDQWISIFLEKPRSSWLDCLITGRGELYSLRALICTVPFESYGKNPRIVLMWSHFCVKVTIRLAKTAVSFPSDILLPIHVRYVGVTVSQNLAEGKLNWGCALFEKYLCGLKSLLCMGKLFVWLGVGWAPRILLLPTVLICSTRPDVESCNNNVLPQLSLKHMGIEEKIRFVTYRGIS